MESPFKYPKVAALVRADQRALIQTFVVSACLHLGFLALGHNVSGDLEAESELRPHLVSAVVRLGPSASEIPPSYQAAPLAEASEVVLAVDSSTASRGELSRPPTSERERQGGQEEAPLLGASTIPQSRNELEIREFLPEPSTEPERTPTPARYPEIDVDRVDVSTPPEPVRSVAQSASESNHPADIAMAGATERPVDEGPDFLDFTGQSEAAIAATRFQGGVNGIAGGDPAGRHVFGSAENTGGDSARVEAVRGRRSRARDVSLPARNWNCPWPSSAGAWEVDEETVVIQVAVGADGRASHVRLVSDPGHGFGEAAMNCARQVRFRPARDNAGEPCAATSPPIRVRFTR